MSKKTSTAALDSFRERQLPNRRRGPRHPAGRRRSNEVKTQRSNETAREFGQAQIVVRREGVMHRNGGNGVTGKVRVILPVILRITFCLAMWTIGAMPLLVPLTEAQAREHRVVQAIPVDRARVDNLQRWVNSGHDTWCRDANAVATMAVRRISPEFANYDFEIASLTTEGDKPSPSKAVYVFHSLDGHTSYRVTVRRFRWQTKSANTPDCRIWVPVRSETITRYSLD
jgi:hypothetical protein